MYHYVYVCGVLATFQTHIPVISRFSFDFFEIPRLIFPGHSNTGLNFAPENFAAAALWPRPGFVKVGVRGWPRL